LNICVISDRKTSKSAEYVGEYEMLAEILELVGMIETKCLMSRVELRRCFDNDLKWHSMFCSTDSKHTPLLSIISIATRTDISSPFAPNYRYLSNRQHFAVSV